MEQKTVNLDGREFRWYSETGEVLAANGKKVADNCGTFTKAVSAIRALLIKEARGRLKHDRRYAS